MSCQQSSMTENGYQYSHDETATIRIYPSSKATTSANHGTTPPPWSLNSRVLIESTSTLQSSTPLFRQYANDDAWNIAGDSVPNTGTPFSKQVLELLSRYPMQRLLIRIGDAAASSLGGLEQLSTHAMNEGESIDEQQLLQEERARGPSGTSILASFVQPTNTMRQAKEYYQGRYASLLRYLLDNGLFPPCGAPLDSLRVRKHGHSTIVHSPSTSPNGATIPTVNVESFLAADAATFCNPGIYSFLLSKEEKGGGWGAATSNGACHSSDSWGLFDSLFSSSSGLTLSESLLGASLDATPWESGGAGGEKNKRNSIWIDMQVSPSCFVTNDGSNQGEECSVKVTRGASYRVGLPSPTRTVWGDGHNKKENQMQSHSLNLSLGDLLLGHNTVDHSLASEESEAWKEWHPCPLSDSSRILMYHPKGYVATLEDGISMVRNGFDGDAHTGKMEFNALAWKDGHIDLAAPLAQFHPVNENIGSGKHLSVPSSSSSLFGISRTVQRPLGVSSSGTLVTILRYGQGKTLESEQSHVVEVQSLDVLPGTLIKPRMHTLRMTLYHGGGAGGERFVPTLNSDDRPCECIGKETDTSNSCPSSDQRGSIYCTDIILSELQDHKLTLHSDGTILLERTVNLRPDSSLWMMVDFDEAYLPFQKFPADANRGVDMFPSRATFTPVVILETAKAPPTTLYSPSLLILPPVPDMSMPFNVISLSCTLWAFVLGSLLNILVRRGTESIKREFTGEKEKRPLDKLKDKLKEKGRALKEKLRSLKGKSKSSGLKVVEKEK